MQLHNCEFYSFFDFLGMIPMALEVGPGCILEALSIEPLFGGGRCRDGSLLTPFRYIENSPNLQCTMMCDLC